LKKVLILNYHLIDNKTYEFDSFGGIYAVKIEDFKEQMQVLKDNNIPVVSLKEVLNNNITENFNVAITFDDGNPSDFDVVYPVLKRHNYTASFFLCIQNIKENNSAIWEHYRKMKREGFEIASHGLTHRDLTKIEDNLLIKEMQNSKLIIEKNLETSVLFFSLPFGMYNKNVIKSAKDAGYKSLLSTHFKFADPEKKSFLSGRWSIKRTTSIDDFKLIIQNDRLTILKYRCISFMKKFFISGMGSSLTNKLYTFKNKHLSKK